MTKFAVIDCGRARWKASIRDKSRPFTVEDRYQVEVGANASDDRLQEIATDVRRFVQVRLVADIVAVGGHAIRELQSSNPAGLVRVESALGARIRVLSASMESQLLFKAVSFERSSNDILVVDLGGGSVQWIESEADVVNWETAAIGTHSLESQYGLKHGSSVELYDKVAVNIEESVRTVSSRLSGRTTIVLGSNCFASFITSASDYFGVKVSDDAGFPALSDTALNELFRYCCGAEEGAFERVFPANPMFMYGADKALLVASVTSRLIPHVILSGTDLGVVDGLAVDLAQGERF